MRSPSCVLNASSKTHTFWQEQEGANLDPAMAQQLLQAAYHLQLNSLRRTC